MLPQPERTYKNTTRNNSSSATLIERFPIFYFFYSKTFLFPNVFSAMERMNAQPASGEREAINLRQAVETPSGEARGQTGRKTKKLKYQSTSHFLPPLYNGCCMESSVPGSRPGQSSSKVGAIVVREERNVSVCPEASRRRHRIVVIIIIFNFFFYFFDHILFRLAKSIKQILSGGSSNGNERVSFCLQQF